MKPYGYSFVLYLRTKLTGDFGATIQFHIIMVSATIQFCSLYYIIKPGATKIFYIIKVKVEHYPFAIFLPLKDLCKTRIWHTDMTYLAT